VSWRRRIAVLLGAASPFAVSQQMPALSANNHPEFTPPVLDRDLFVFSDPAVQGRLSQLAGESAGSQYIQIVIGTKDLHQVELRLPELDPPHGVQTFVPTQPRRGR
jgi:hypothetical protein